MIFMKLRRTEIIALALTLLFAAVTVGWQLGVSRRAPVFRVTAAAETAAAETAERAAPDGALTEKINLNTADAETLKTLTGIGDVLAERIIAWREENGPFARPEDIMLVSGIGKKLYEANAARIMAGEDGT